MNTTLLELDARANADALTSSTVQDILRLADAITADPHGQDTLRDVATEHLPELSPLGRSGAVLVLLPFIGGTPTPHGAEENIALAAEALQVASTLWRAQAKPHTSERAHSLGELLLLVAATLQVEMEGAS